MFYVLEGIDGSGKTSVGNRIAQISPVVYSEIIKEKSRCQNEKPVDTFQELVSYFMSGGLNLIAGLNPGLVNLVGRYYHSTIINSSLLFDAPIDIVEQKINSYNLIKPMNTFLLNVDREEQIRRIKDKGVMSYYDQKVLLDEEHSKKMGDYYNSVAERENWSVIDTTSRTIDEVAKDILVGLAE